MIRSPENVERIKDMYLRKGKTKAQIARELACSTRTVYNALTKGVAANVARRVSK